MPPEGGLLPLLWFEAVSSVSPDIFFGNNAVLGSSSTLGSSIILLFFLMLYPLSFDT